MSERTLTLQERENIRERLIKYCDRYPSRNSAANSLRDVSAATVSFVINGHWDKVNDRMLMNISWQVGSTDTWRIAETSTYSRTTFALSDAQTDRRVHWVVGDAGSGKTTAAKAYRDTHQNVYYILCSEDMSKGEFIREIGRQIGVPEYGSSLREMLYIVINSLASRYCPLLIFDEADKLKDNVLAYFITLYNQLEDNVGIVFLSTSYIIKRMNAGLRFNKKGYQEIHSRIGRKFMTLEPTNVNEVHSICHANGLSAKDIKKVVADSAQCRYDLRRVKKMVGSLKKAQAAKEAKDGENTVD